MRPLKLILTACVAAFAVVAALFIAAVAALTSVAFFLVRRWRGPGHDDSRRTAPLPPPANASRRPKASENDVIDVIATEVPAEPPSR